MRRFANLIAAHPALILGGSALALHLWANGGYDYFRDELYFIVCGEHPAWGYVDQSPLIPLLAALLYHLFPGSLVMLRLPSALGHAASVVLTAAGFPARGDRAAQCGDRAGVDRRPGGIRGLAAEPCLSIPVPEEGSG